MIDELIHKIKRKWMKMRLQPIRVLCFHQVSDAFDESYMERGDWLRTDVFKQRIEGLQQEGYVFISLPEAQEKMKRDRIRCKKYVVLTADDGWATLRNVLPWLNEQQIPVTLFLNPAYLDGKHYRDSEKEEYLTEVEVRNLHKQYPLVTVGSHGWDHVAATRQTEDEFRESIKRAKTYLSELPNYIPYYAYTWGWRNAKTNGILAEDGMMQVNMDGEMNYNDHNVIHRELLI
ncbi:MAG: polysaccharide deacetylase family protein [Paludibacteraceae bacterium]|nr:polysaccharide deacetylase family protein [Paludibacteraceae bacterium]